MSDVPLYCSNCGKPVDFPPGRDFCFCINCGHRITLLDPPSRVGSTGGSDNSGLSTGASSPLVGTYAADDVPGGALGYVELTADSGLRDPVTVELNDRRFTSTVRPGDTISIPAFPGESKLMVYYRGASSVKYVTLSNVRKIVVLKPGFLMGNQCNVECVRRSG